MAACTIVVEIAGDKLLINLDRGHRLEIRKPGGPAAVIEARPVTEFSAAVDSGGKLHVAAWLLSRQLMYYTSADGETFTRSALVKSDGFLRIKDLLIFSDGGVSIAYVAEAEYTDTLVYYRWEGEDWDGKRLVEVEHPQRLSAFQFDGAPGGLCVLYGVKDTGRTAVMSRPLAGDLAPETVTAVAGGLTDFCALTSGGARQACWIADGRLTVNGVRQPDEPWSRTWPHFRRDEGGVQCLWMEGNMLCGMTIGAQRARLRPAAVRDALPCILALPGETRKAVVDGAALREAQLLPELPDRQAAMRSAQQPPAERPEGHRGRNADLTLTDVVRNQAVYLTRMQESLGAMERSVLKMQAEVNRLGREFAAHAAAEEKRPKASQFSISTVKKDKETEIKEKPAAKTPAKPPSANIEEDIRDELSEPAEEVKQGQKSTEATKPAEPQENGDSEAPGEDFPVVT